MEKLVTINFEAPATVQMLDLPDSKGYAAGGCRWEGTLVGAVKHVMAMSPDERLRASIMLDSDTELGTTWLDISDIEKVYRRDDFPSD
jgi:hypothetical protein